MLKDIDTGIWNDNTSGKRDNLHFIWIDNDKDVQLSFSIELADLYIGSRSDTLYFLRESSMIYFNWGDRFCTPLRFFPAVTNLKNMDYARD